jgi:hypothetical protein
VIVSVSIQVVDPDSGLSSTVLVENREASVNDIKKVAKSAAVKAESAVSA